MAQGPGASSQVIGASKERCGAHVRHALDSNPSLEARRGLESLLSRPWLHSPETLLQVPAIQVLEQIASKDFRGYLTELENGMADAPERQAAKAAFVARSELQFNHTPGAKSVVQLGSVTQI
jgi:hypothetical protein